MSEDSFRLFPFACIVLNLIFSIEIHFWYHVTIIKGAESQCFIKEMFTSIAMMSIVPTCNFFDKFGHKLCIIHQTLFHVRWKQRWLDLISFSLCACYLLLLFIVCVTNVLFTRIEINIDYLNFFWGGRCSRQLLISFWCVLWEFRAFLNVFRRIRFLLYLRGNYRISESSAMPAPLSFILGIRFHQSCCVDWGWRWISCISIVNMNHHFRSFILAVQLFNLFNVVLSFP